MVDDVWRLSERGSQRARAKCRSGIVEVPFPKPISPLKWRGVGGGLHQSQITHSD